MVVLAANTRFDLESFGTADDSRWRSRHPVDGGRRGKFPDGGGKGRSTALVGPIHNLTIGTRSHDRGNLVM